MEKLYKIVRFEYPDCFKSVRTVLTGLTLKEAQEHCKDPETREEGVYFDGYTEQ